MHVVLVALAKKIKEKKKTGKFLEKAPKMTKEPQWLRKYKVCTGNIWKVTVLVY